MRYNLSVFVQGREDSWRYADTRRSKEKCLKSFHYSNEIKTQTRFQNPLLLEKIAQTGAKALIAIPLKFKFVFDACPLSSPAFSFSNHVLDGVELIRMGIGFQL